MSLPSQAKIGGYGGGALAPSSGASGIHGQLDTALDIAQRCVHKSDMVLERIDGPRPQDANAGIASASPLGIPEKLNQLIHHLGAIDDRLGDVLNRF